MIRCLRLLATATGVLGVLLALPGLLGLLLLMGASQVSAMAVGLEQQAHDDALYPSDLAPESEPK